MSVKIQDFDESLLDQEFKELALKMAHFGELLDVVIRPFHNSSLPLFNRLPLEAKIQSLKALKTYVEICEETTDSGGELSSLTFIWQALKKFDLRHPGNLFEKLKDSDVVEIHNLEGIQIFRNFQFYSYCSYTIEELYTEPWDYLFQHDENALPLLLQFVKDCVSGKRRSASRLDIPTYEIKEKYSMGSFVLKVKMKMGAPLFDSDRNIVATLVASDGQLVSFKEFEGENERSPLTLI